MLATGNKIPMGQVKAKLYILLNFRQCGDKGCRMCPKPVWNPDGISCAMSRAKCGFKQVNEAKPFMFQAYTDDRYWSHCTHVGCCKIHDSRSK